MIPKDPMMLLSYVNTQLRDTYPSLEDFCNTADVSEEEITESLKNLGYVYDSELNKFVRH
ncbi:MAG: DUF4250 domain-containing protein [Erysipelotrichaceae bacterium]|nr:DUF4250 domain-containing protein [Erysipelotrichaceae bacterium]